MIIIIIRMLDDAPREPGAYKPAHGARRALEVRTLKGVGAGGGGAGGGGGGGGGLRGRGGKGAKRRFKFSMEEEDRTTWLPDTRDTADYLPMPRSVVMSR